MAKQTIREADVVQMTIDNIHSFYGRAKDVTTAPMTDDFMWIGSNDVQWAEGRNAFLRVTRNEYTEPPVLLSEEEYHTLFHERGVWVVYGKYTATAVAADGGVLHAHVRVTYVWRRVKGEIRLAHIHGSHAQDIPLNQTAPAPAPIRADSSLFDAMRRLDIRQNNTNQLLFRDEAGKHRLFSPEDILFLQAAGAHTVVHTKTEIFTVSGLLAKHEAALPDWFRRIHKSYLVNTRHIAAIRRFQAILKDGQELPIGKERCMDLKRYLQGTEPTRE